MTNSSPHRRSPFPLREELPTPNEQADHFRKHPSDFHADSAVGYLLQSIDEPDAVRRQNIIRCAEVCATLSLRDAVLEATSTLKDIANQLPERKD